MDSNRKTAIAAGVLFIVATVASIASVPFLSSTTASDYLTSISANQNQVLVGALLSFIAALASASIAISLYPVLKRYSQGLALGAVGFRLIEGVFYIVGIVFTISLVSLSQEFVKAGAPSSSYFQTVGTVLLAGHDWASFVGSAMAFGIGAMLYYIIFYRTKLIPRWLSIWGLVGVTLSMVSTMLVMFHVISPFSTVQLILNLPFIAVQEMVLAVWLIVKGFNPSAIASEPANQP